MSERRANNEEVNKSLKSISMVSEDSKKFSVKLGSRYADVLQQIKDEADHKHWTTGTVLYEVCTMMDSDLEAADNGAFNEELVNKLLSGVGVPVEVVDRLGVPDNAETVESDETERVVVYLPESLYEQLPYFKAEYFEQRLTEWLESPFSSRLERARVKRDLVRVVNNDGSRDGVSVRTRELLNEFDELERAVDSVISWYAGLSVDEVEERIVEETKQTAESRVPALEYLFELRLNDVETLASGSLSSVHIKSQIEKEMLQGEEVGYISDVLDCTDKTARKYWEMIDDYWTDEGWMLEFVDEYTEDIVKEIVDNMKFNDKESMSLNKSNPAHLLALREIKDEGEDEAKTEVSVGGDVLVLWNLGSGDYSFKIQ